jgi:hypothetical protein
MHDRKRSAQLVRRRDDYFCRTSSLLVKQPESSYPDRVDCFRLHCAAFVW